jgi:hypothetical protein
MNLSRHMTDHVSQPPHSPSPCISALKRHSSVDLDQVPAKRARSTKPDELPVALALSFPFRTSSLSTIGPSSYQDNNTYDSTIPPITKPTYTSPNAPSLSPFAIPIPSSFSRSSLYDSTVSSVVPPSSPIKPSQTRTVAPTPKLQPHDLHAHNPARPTPPNTKKYKHPNSERLQLLAKFIDIINDEEFCVGCTARRHPIVSLHQLSNCPRGIADYRDKEWLRWRKTLIFPKSVGICGGCGVSTLVRVLCFIS